MPSIKFTAAKIKFLEGVRGKQVDYFDKALSGFFVRVSQDGKKSFGVMYRKDGRLRRMKLGTYPLLTLGKARQEALKSSAKCGTRAGSSHRETRGPACRNFRTGCAGIP